MNWRPEDVSEFLELFSTLWPGVLLDPKTSRPTRIAAYWIDSFKGYQIAHVLEGLRGIFGSQEIHRAPTPKKLRESIADARGGAGVNDLERERRIIARMDPEVRPIYEERLAGRRDPELSWEEFRDRVLSGDEPTLDPGAFEWLRCVLDGTMKRQRRGRGWTAIREPGKLLFARRQREPGEEED